MPPKKKPTVSSGESVRVVCRIRPLNVTAATESADCTEIKGNQIVVNDPESANKKSTFSFDRILGPTSTQEDVYSAAAKHIVEDFIKGYNGTIFAYGQTSGGKTHTMQGETKHGAEGIIPRVCSAIIEHMGDDHQLEISVYEMYMEKLLDLLSGSSAALAIREIKGSVQIVGLAVRYVGKKYGNVLHQCMDALETAGDNRKVGKTKMNATSSRSHLVYAINYEREVSGKKISSRLNLVDLAGSERLDKTEAEGHTKDEGIMINKSLTCLVSVIKELSEGSKHIRFRDSKLTRVLEASLGGNSKTCMVICCSPAARNAKETVNTLRIGNQAKMIKNRAIVNMTLTAEMWEKKYNELLKETEKLRECVKDCQNELTKWRSGQHVPETERTKIQVDVATDLSPSSDTPDLHVSAEQLPVEELQNKLDELDKKYFDIYDQNKELQEKLKTLTAERDAYSEEVSKQVKNGESKDAEFQMMVELIEQLNQSTEETQNQLEKTTAEMNKAITVNLLALKDKQESSAKNAALNDRLLGVKKEYDETLSEINNKLHEVCVAFNPRQSVAINTTVDSDTILRIIDRLAMYGKDKHEKLKCAELNVNDRKEVVGVLQKMLDKQVGSIKSGEFRKNYEKGQAEIISSLQDKLQSLLLSNKTESNNTADSSDKQFVPLSRVEHLKRGYQECLEGYNERIRKQEEYIKKLESDNLAMEIEYRTVTYAKEAIIGEVPEPKTNANVDSEVDLLSDTIDRQMTCLKSYRDKMLRELSSRIDVSTERLKSFYNINSKDMSGVIEDEMAVNSRVDRAKIKYLEENIERMVAVHQEVVKRNAQIQIEYDKLDLRTTSFRERTKELEDRLKTEKENNVRAQQKFDKDLKQMKGTMAKMRHRAANTYVPVTSANDDK